MNMFKGENVLGRPMPNALGERAWKPWAKDYADIIRANYGEPALKALREHLNGEAANDDAREEAVRNERYALRLKQGC
ncbi:hypothetical protein [Aestuariivirga sp.]|uniref:hypothetical protein n=1 Tax=Aestuariivirga sp. TaxID=2650926 RepID=UPI0039E34DAA